MLEGTSGRHLAQPPTASSAKLEQVSLGLVWLGSEYLKGWRVHIFAGQPVTVVNHSHGRNVSHNI